MPAVSVSAITSTPIVPVDYDRTMVVITNADTAANLHISFGGTATTNDAYIAPGGNMTIGADSRCYVGINGLSSFGTITAKYSKLSAGS